MRTRTFIWTIGLLCCVALGHAQGFTVSPAPSTPDSLIRQQLAGEGVVLSNGTFTYGANTTTSGSISSNPQIGIFNRGNVNFPIASGIVMTTSNLSSISQHSSLNANIEVTNDTVTPDALLSTIMFCPIHDRAAMDFDFVSFSDTVAFNYVFASEEYPDFVCSSYSDEFGFFIKGYNPVTNTIASWNVALLPNGITPVAINTVNGGVSHGSATPCILTNTQYYHQNSNSPPVFNGYTVKLTASATILACRNYHMHLAIADGYDGYYDSGIFLEEGSFHSPSMKMDTVWNISGLGDTLVQNCREVDVKYTLPRPLLSGMYRTHLSFPTAHPDMAEVGRDYKVTVDVGQNTVELNDIVNEFFYQQGDTVRKIHVAIVDTAHFDAEEVKDAMIIITTVFCDDYFYNGYPDAGRVDTLVFHLKGNDGTYVDQHSLDKNITISPNPTDNVFTINSTIGIIKELTIFDNSGKAVLSQNVNDYSGRINVEQLPSGIYFVRIEISGNFVTKKLIIK